MILFVTIMMAVFGAKPISERRPKPAAWRTHVQERPCAVGQQMAAIEKFQKTATPVEAGEPYRDAARYRCVRQKPGNPLACLKAA
jgi:hypothetical protein